MANKQHDREEKGGTERNDQSQTGQRADGDGKAPREQKSKGRDTNEQDGGRNT